MVGSSQKRLQPVRYATRIHTGKGKAKGKAKGKFEASTGKGPDKDPLCWLDVGDPPRESV